MVIGNGHIYFKNCLYFLKVHSRLVSDCKTDHYLLSDVHLSQSN